MLDVAAHVAKQQPVEKIAFQRMRAEDPPKSLATIRMALLGRRYIGPTASVLQTFWIH
jgi:hypothetical protein